MVLIISVGISIDYSAHIAQCFLRQKGDRKEQTTLFNSLQLSSFLLQGCAKACCISALVEVGPAVFNGAFSTFLSIVLLSLANSYAVVVFFKVFVLSVAFAFYNSVVALPVVMSVLGRPSQEGKREDIDKEEEEVLLEKVVQ